MYTEQEASGYGINMNEQDADTVIILSSELIAEVMEVHFNKVMFKQKVHIVDLKPTETGYAFSLAFVTSIKIEENSKFYDSMKSAMLQNDSVNSVSNGDSSFTSRDNITKVRDDKGRYTKKGLKNEQNTAITR